MQRNTSSGGKVHDAIDAGSLVHCDRPAQPMSLSEYEVKKIGALSSNYKYEKPSIPLVPERLG
jgi:hypothetical protein